MIADTLEVPVVGGSFLTGKCGSMDSGLRRNDVREPEPIAFESLKSEEIAPGVYRPRWACRWLGQPRRARAAPILWQFP